MANELARAFYLTQDQVRSLLAWWYDSNDLSDSDYEIVGMFEDALLDWPEYHIGLCTLRERAVLEFRLSEPEKEWHTVRVTGTREYDGGYGKARIDQMQAIIRAYLTIVLGVNAYAPGEDDGE